jgi:hypothetical protein
VSRAPSGEPPCSASWRGARSAAPAARSLPVAAYLAAGFALSLLSACESPPPRPNLDAIVDPYSELVVIGPDRGFDPSRPPSGWHLASASASGRPRFTVAEKAGVVALRVVGGASGAALFREVRAPLLTMPYLRWGWYLDPPGRQLARAVPAEGPMPGGPAAPLWLVVGFAGGRPPGAAARPGDGEGGLPGCDRTLALVWSAEPQLRIDRDGEGTASYVVRQGPAGAGRWVLESVDLSRIYREVWPQDRAGDASVVFVGAGSGGVADPTTGYVAEVVLSP